MEKQNEIWGIAVPVILRQIGKFSMESIFINKVKAYKESMAEQKPEFEKIVKTPFFYDYLKDMLTSLTQGKTVPLKLVLLEKDNDKKVRVSHTNGKMLYINVENDLVQDFATDQNKVFCILGSLFHEVGHILYLNLKAEKRAIKQMEKSGKIPYEEQFDLQLPADEMQADLASNLKEAVKNPAYHRIFSQLYTSISDVISDAHDEERLCREGGILIRKSIMTMREGLFSKTKAVEDMAADRSYAPLTIMLSLILQYARYGKVFVLREETYEKYFYLHVLNQAKPYIDMAKETDDVSVKFTGINGILMYLWPYIRVVVQKNEGFDSEENKSDEDAEKEEMGIQSEPEECEDCEDCESCKPPEPDEDSEGKGGGECGEDGAPQVGDEVMKQIQKAVGSCGGDSFSDPPANIMRSGFAQQTMQDAGGRKEDFSIETGSDPGKIVEQALQDIEADMLEDLAEEMAAEELHSEALAKIRTGNVYSVHFGVQTNIKRAKPIAGDKEFYDRIVKENLSFIKKTQKEIDKIIQEEEIAVQKHRYLGRKIDAKSAYKVDQRFFTKKRNPEKVVDMAIAVLVDNSGSMEGKRIESAKEAAILLTEVLERMGIPVFVAGHNCESALCFQIFKNFEDTKYAKYSINRMFPGGDNRDGLALDVAGTYLIERQETNKLLIIISDGQPNSHGYSGELAKKDIKSIVKNYRRQEIKTLAFAIGDDKKQVKDIYGEAYIDISDYDKFPKTLSKMIEREIISHI